MNPFRYIQRFYSELYLSTRLLSLLAFFVLGYVLSFFFSGLYSWVNAFAAAAALVLFSDLFLLFFKRGINAERECPEKLSNGDVNLIELSIENRYGFPVRLAIIDELPPAFEKRDFLIQLGLTAGKKKNLQYTIRPTERGEYEFGLIRVFVSSPIGLIQRRLNQGKPHVAKVYPSYLEMRKYEFLAISNRLREFGLKKIRRIGHNYEFEQIKEYVTGDDFRTINWKASARKNKWMVNQYQDERSQQVIHLIDKGRVMKNPFRGMTLLDYAVNTSLMLSNIAIKKHDKAGLITFDHKHVRQVPADRKGNQMQRIQEALYSIKTDFMESDYEKMFAHVRKTLQQRSLLLIYTNFDTVSSMERYLKYLRGLARYHLVVVVFFQNTENEAFIQQPTKDLRDVYLKTIAEDFENEKKRIAEELRKHGIMSVLSAPEDLSVNTLNKYLELKARGLV